MLLLYTTFPMQCCTGRIVTAFVYVCWGGGEGIEISAMVDERKSASVIGWLCQLYRVIMFWSLSK